MRLVLLRHLHLICIFMDAIKSEFLTLTFQSDCEGFSSYQTIKLSPLYYKVNELRFTSLATTVYLSHSPSPTHNCNVSSSHFPKCMKNKGCFIFPQEIEIGNDILFYISIK